MSVNPIVKVMQELEKTMPNGVSIDDIEHQGFSETEVIHHIKALMTEGIVTEPMIGVFKLTGMYKNEEDKKDVWDDVTEETEREFIGFKETNEITITFEENDFEKRKTKFSTEDKASYINMFKVLNHKGIQMFFSTGSSRLMNLLKEVRPLEGKSFRIIRTGANFETNYTIKEIV